MCKISFKLILAFGRYRVYTRMNFFSLSSSKSISLASFAHPIKKPLLKINVSDFTLWIVLLQIPEYSLQPEEKGEYVMDRLG